MVDITSLAKKKKETLSLSEISIRHLILLHMLPTHASNGSIGTLLSAKNTGELKKNK